MSLFLINLFAGFLLCCSSVVLTQDRPAYSSDCWSGDKEHYRMSLRHIESGGIGYDKGYTTLDAFFAPTPDTVNLMPFLDVRGHGFDDGNVGANIGVGLRKIMGCRIYGANIYYDYRNVDKVNYAQMGFGIERLGKRWDFRVNAYLPVETKITPIGPITFAEFAGHEALLAQNYEFAMKGFNANFGVHFGKNRFCDFYACAGPYFYAGQVGQHIWGGKASFMIRFNKYVNIELSNSFDKMFHDRFQASIGFTMPFGKSSNNLEIDDYNSCDVFDLLLSRMTQPVQRQEIVVVGNSVENSIAINPATGEPFRFVFVDNTSHSYGTYEVPYHTLRQAQADSKINDIIYVFPGDGTTQGMDSGIILKQNQNFWGSGTPHILEAAQGNFIIPAQSFTMPTITNTNFDTLGDGITLSSINKVSGFNFVDVLNDAIHGDNVQSFSVDNCTFQGTGTYCINTTSASQAFVSVASNTMTSNTNGSLFSFNGPSTLLVSGNSISDASSVSSFPLTIVSGASPISATITNNLITGNTTGGIQFVLNDTDSAQLTVSGNTIVNNTSGSTGSLGSALFINPNSTSSGNCQLNMTDNIITGNAASALYCSSGNFNDFQLIAAGNVLTGNGGGGFILNNNYTTLTFTATDNVISNNGDNAILTGSNTIPTATMTISNNQITGNTGSGNAIALSHSGTDLDVTVTNNNMSNNDGTGILMYSSGGAGFITNVAVDIDNNIISNNLNTGVNGAAGIDLEQYNNLLATITNNTFSDNASNTASDLYVATTASSAEVQLEMSGNGSSPVISTNYVLSNVGGTFDLAPCNVTSVNTGTILVPADPVTPVTTCPDGEPCS